MSSTLSLPKLVGLIRSDKYASNNASSPHSSKPIILVTHGQEGSFFRNIGFQDFDAAIAGVFDTSEDHTPGLKVTFEPGYDPYDDGGDPSDGSSVSLTNQVKRCRFDQEPVSDLHPAPLLIKQDDKSSKAKLNREIFEGAHDGSNDAYWTLRVCLKLIQEELEAQTHELAAKGIAAEWAAPFGLVAIDFEANNNLKVRQAGIARLDSQDLDYTTMVTMDSCKNKIVVRSLAVEGLTGAKDEADSCKPDCGPMFTDGHEVMSTARMVEELRALLTPA